jgi:hypothetical protein
VRHDGSRDAVGYGCSIIIMAKVFVDPGRVSLWRVEADVVSRSGSDWLLLEYGVVPMGGWGGVSSLSEERIY